MQKNMIILKRDLNNQKNACLSADIVCVLLCLPNLK